MPTPVVLIIGQDENEHFQEVALLFSVYAKFEKPVQHIAERRSGEKLCFVGATLSEAPVTKASPHPSRRLFPALYYQRPFARLVCQVGRTFAADREYPAAAILHFMSVEECLQCLPTIAPA